MQTDVKEIKQKHFQEPSNLLGETQLLTRSPVVSNKNEEPRRIPLAEEKFEQDFSVHEKRDDSNLLEIEENPSNESVRQEVGDEKTSEPPFILGTEQPLKPVFEQSVLIYLKNWVSIYLKMKRKTSHWTGIKHENDVLGGIVTEKNQEIAGLQAELQRARSTIGNTAEELTCTKMQHQKEMEEKAKEINELKESLIAAEYTGNIQIDSLNNEVRVLKKNIVGLTAKVVANTKEDSKNKELKLESALQARNKMRSELCKKLKSVEEELETAKKKIESGNTQLKQQHLRIQSSEKEISELAAENVKNNEVIQDLQEKNGELSKFVDNVKNAMEMLAPRYKTMLELTTLLEKATMA
ncbi:unnamed protein product [Orchesella dallaii]|uniref:Uncharacterized protein n=1 Tax=Orchesella dallaii TaxID=48710 RepID=A0ABP1RRQ7_9HEXA